jgi:hypothetical protein
VMSAMADEFWSPLKYAMDELITSLSNGCVRGSI